MENILEIKNLNKKYDGFELKNVNITFVYKGLKIWTV